MGLIAKLFLTFLVLVLVNPTFAEKWEFVSKKKGITVERVYVKGSPVLKFKGKGVIDSSVVRILAVLQDIKNQKRWNKNSYDNKILEKKSDKEIIVYNAAKVPWPFQDRDFIVHLKFHIDEVKRDISIVGKEVKHPKAPKHPDRYRIPLMRTKWYFKPLKKYKGKKTWVEFMVHSDPGGNMPNWLINFISKYIPYKTILNIRRLAKSNKVDKSFLEKYKKFENWY